jgi:hypothetical protein
VNNTELGSIEKKIEILNNKKNLLIQKEKLKSRKLLNKQKIIMGGWLINQLENYSVEKREAMSQKILASIPDYRKADVGAITDLFMEVK